MAKIIPKNVIEDVRARSDIVDVIGSYFELKRRGNAYLALCPFHREKTPSFNVNPARQIFHCFGCGAGGDVFGFVSKYEGVDFVAAVRMLAERAGVRIEMEEGAREAGSEKAALLRLHEEAAGFYHEHLLKSPGAEHARAYLRKRDLDDAAARDYLIGYAPDSWDALIQWAVKRRYGMAQLEAAGLVVKREDADGRTGHYDRFRNRLMFAIRDEIGRVIAFSGRVLTSDPQAAKYVNSPETILFHKSRVLYGLDKAKHAFRETSEALICEGQIDVIRCHLGGFKSAVAAQGTAFTEEHAHIINRYAEGVVLMFDSDDAGQRAAVKTAAIFLQTGLTVRVAALPAGHDPDSFILKEGPEAFRRIVDAAQPCIDFQIALESARHDLRTDIGLKRAERALLETVSAVTNSAQRTRMVDRIAQRLAISPQAVLADLAQIRVRHRPPEPAAPAPQGPPAEERELAALVVAHPELADLVLRYLGPRRLTDAACRRVVQVCAAAQAGGKQFVTAFDASDPADRDALQFAARLEAAPRKVRGQTFSPEDAVKDLILFIYRRDLKKRRDEIDRSLAAADAAQRRALTEESAQVRSDMRVFADWQRALPLMEDLAQE